MTRWTVVVFIAAIVVPPCPSQTFGLVGNINYYLLNHTIEYIIILYGHTFVSFFVGLFGKPSLSTTATMGFASVCQYKLMGKIFLTVSRGKRILETTIEAFAKWVQLLI